MIQHRGADDDGSPLDRLEHHAGAARQWLEPPRPDPYRPDPVGRSQVSGLPDNLLEFRTLTADDTETWDGYPAPHRRRREYFRRLGATLTDRRRPNARPGRSSRDARRHALPSHARSASRDEARGTVPRADAVGSWRAWSRDASVMQLHQARSAIAVPRLQHHFGRDRGTAEFRGNGLVHALKPLLDRFGNGPRLTVIVFTLDENYFARDSRRSPGSPPALRLGPLVTPRRCHRLMRFQGPTPEPAASATQSNSTTAPSIPLDPRPSRHGAAVRRLIASPAWCPSTGSTR